MNHQSYNGYNVQKICSTTSYLVQNSREFTKLVLEDVTAEYQSKTLLATLVGWYTPALAPIKYMHSIMPDKTLDALEKLKNGHSGIYINSTRFIISSLCEGK